MTNKDAYMIYFSDEGAMMLSLGKYSIDPSATDNNYVSAALGMIERICQPDYKQGNTSETLSTSTRNYLYSRAMGILNDAGIDVDEFLISKQIVTGSDW
jgi:hypothetical protein